MKYFNHIASDMKKSEDIPQFNTHISEREHSKKTIINIINELRNYLSEEIYSVESDRVSTFRFSGVGNYDGCIYLSGYEVRGSSLYELYRSYRIEPFYSQETQEFLNIVKHIAEASELIKRETGFYPPLLLNCIYISRGTSTQITFISAKIVAFLNRYYEIDLQKTLRFCTEFPSSLSLEEERFPFALAKLIYLFFTKRKGVSFEPIFDISGFVPDTPRSFSNTLWNVLHRKKMSPFNEAVKRALNERGKASSAPLPLFRREPFLLFGYKIRTLIRNRWRLMAATLVSLCIISYLLADFFVSRRGVDYTAGLTAKEVVELYFTAINNLDIGMIDSLFYRHAGKKLKNELSSFYVIKKMEQVYGGRMTKPGQPDPEQIESDARRLFGIEDLNIEQISDEENHVFSATYKKVIRKEDEKTEYSIEEIIYLKLIRERWYIINNQIKEIK